MRRIVHGHFDHCRPRRPTRRPRTVQVSDVHGRSTAATRTDCRRRRRAVVRAIAVAEVVRRGKRMRAGRGAGRVPAEVQRRCRAHGETGEKSGEYAEDLAATMLATTLGLEFDPDKAWDERKQIYDANPHMFKTRHYVQSAEGNKNGLWTTTLAAAVLIRAE